MDGFIEYKGFKIKAYRDTECGYYWCVTRLNDDWILDDSYNPAIKTKQEAIKDCKVVIDDYYENPSDYED